MTIPVKLQTALTRLTKDFPFHAGLLSKWNIAADETCETMAVTASSDSLKVSLLYSLDFLNELTMEELESVLQHEVLHVVFGHLDLDPKQFEHPDLLTIAEEVTANEFVKGNLPGKPILLEHFPCLKQGQSTRERYRILAEKRLTSNAADGNMKDDRKCNGNGEGSGNPGDKTGAPKDKERTMPEPVDDHSKWGQPDPLVSQMVRGDMAEAYAELSEDEKAKVVPGIKAAIGRGGALFPGVGAGSDLAKIGVTDRRLVKSWALLNRYVGAELARSARFNYPSRRLPELVGIIPSRRLVSEKPSIMAVIDTSGSMTIKELEFISAELKHLSRQYEIVVVECDFHIQRVYTFSGHIDNVMGGGGTDFCPVFENRFLAEHRPDLLLYFTDGFGSAPEKAPALPVIWIVYGGVAPAKWGKVIQVSVQNKQ